MIIIFTEGDPYPAANFADIQSIRSMLKNKNSNTKIFLNYKNKKKKKKKKIRKLFNYKFILFT